MGEGSVQAPGWILHTPSAPPPPVGQFGPRNLDLGSKIPSLGHAEANKTLPSIRLSILSDAGGNLPSVLLSIKLREKWANPQTNILFRAGAAAAGAAGPVFLAGVQPPAKDHW